MTTDTNGSSPAPNRSSSILSSLLIAGILLGALWFAAQKWLPTATATPSQPTSISGTNDWPTPPPTFTPIPAPTAPVVVPPTPLPLPAWQEIGEFATIEYYDSFDSEVVHDNWAPGQDRANVRVVASVKMGIDLNQTQTSNLQAENRAITVMLPPIKILSVTYLPTQSKILGTQQQWVLSNYPGLEKEATDKGLAEIQRRADSNERMKGIAAELTKSRVERLLRSYGFNTVEVSFH